MGLVLTNQSALFHGRVVMILKNLVTTLAPV